MRIRIALVISHPIQHFCPQYVSFAEHPGIQFKVFFASALGLKSYTDPGFSQEISWGDLELNRFDHVFLNGEEALPVNKSLDAPSLDNALTEFKPDLVISYGYFQRLQRRAYQWSVRNKVPVGYISDSERRQERNVIKEIIKYPYLRWYFAKISFFLSVGDANEDFYRYYGVPLKKILRMHFPINVKYYEQCFQQRMSLRNSVRAEYGIAEDQFLICVVGKLVEWKNQDHIIDALLLLEKENVFLHLMLLGSGPMQEKWQQKAKLLKKSKALFTGFVDIGKLPAFYAASDLYVHPAAVEPHSIAISEAIYMGCPVVLSDRCGSYGDNDDVQPDKNGFVYPFGNIDKLANEIKRMVLLTEQRRKFSEYSHTIAVHFQQQAHALILEDILMKLK